MQYIDKTEFLFVYGSLLSTFNNHDLIRECQYVSDATVEGLLVSLGAFPAAYEVPKKSGTIKIKGEVYKISIKKRNQIDLLENHPHWYYRIKKSVTLSNGSGLKAWVYYMNKNEYYAKTNVIEDGNWQQFYTQQNKLLYYFAYGSNMNAMRMKTRLAFFVGRKKGILKNYKLTFNKTSLKKNYGYANIESALNVTVEGVLYLVKEKSLLALDVFETTPIHYKRIKINISDFKGHDIAAHTYIANKNMTEDNLIPEQEYLNHLLAGKDFLSNQYYNNLLKWNA